MKKLVMMVCFCWSCNSYAQSRFAEPIKKIDGYKLVWSDEFNKDGDLDKGNWRFENGFVRNEELQWYQPGNAWCENGELIIEAHKEKPNSNYSPGSNEWRMQRTNIEYTSSSINTSGKLSWQYAFESP